MADLAAICAFFRCQPRDRRRYLRDARLGSAGWGCLAGSFIRSSSSRPLAHTTGLARSIRASGRAQPRATGEADDCPTTTAGTQAKGRAATDGAIRPFQVEFPDEALDDLRRRLTATRWPEKETVEDDSQGVPLTIMQDLARYWAAEYDWHGCQARLNALPTSRPRSMVWTSTSSTFARSTRTPCRSSSRTAGRARSSSS